MSKFFQFNPIRRLSMRRPRGFRHAARGFTLLELIVVIAVVGILSAMAVANLKTSPLRAKEAVLKTNLRTLRGRRLCGVCASR